MTDHRNLGLMAARSLITPLSLLLATTAVPASAENAAEAEAAADAGATDYEVASADLDLEKIVVTATKRETNLQKTPIAISVANTQALADRHAQSLLDLGDGSIPSLRVATFEARQSALTVGIRGIVPFDANQTARDQGVGVYIDGVYLGRQQGLNAALLDIDRIEVLRGPQGTLFGRNTEGGAVSIVTKAPTGDFGLRATAGAGNFGSYEGIVHLNLPALENFAIKADAVVDHQGATVENPLDGGLGWNFHHTVGGRIAGRWTPTDKLTVDLSYDRVKEESTPNFSQLINYNPNGFNVGSYNGSGQLVFGGSLCNVNVGGVTTNPCIRPLSPLVEVSGGDRQDSAEIGVPQQASTNKSDGFAGTIKYKASDNLELRSITSWRGVETHQWDNSGGPHRTVFQPNANFSRYSLSELFQNQFSQEVQLVGSLPTIDYVVGAYYFNEHVSEAAATPSTNRWNADGTGSTINSPVVVGPITSGNQGWDRSSWFVQRDSHARARSYAVFGQATWTPEALESLHLTAGARWTKDKREGALTTVANLPTDFEFNYSKSRIDPMVTLAFDASRDIHLYAKYATGYRAGGANDRSATFTAFGPETVKSFELGSKMEFWNQLRINLAAYLMKRKGTQTDFDNVDTDPTSPTFNLHTEETRNGSGTSTIKGLEADIVYSPTGDLKLGASYAYTHVKVPPTPNPFLPGNPLFQVYTVFTPRHAASAFIDFEHPAGIADAIWRLHLDANYAGRQYSFQAEPVKTDSSFIVNGRIALSDMQLNGSDVTLSLWSRNLLNETHIYRRSAANSSPTQVFSGGLPTSQLNYSGVLGDYGNLNPPRTYGLEVSVKL